MSLNERKVCVKCRLSYCNIFQPKAMAQGQEPKYSVSLLISKDQKKALAKINAAIDAAKQKGLDDGKWKGKIPAALKIPLRDGDIDREDDEAYANCFFMNANNKKKPLILDEDKQPVMDESEVYSGCYAKAIVTFYPYNSNGNRGIACSLDGIQKVADGEPLGGAITSADDFDMEDDEEGFFE